MSENYVLFWNSGSSSKLFHALGRIHFLEIVRVEVPFLADGQVLPQLLEASLRA